MNLSLIIFMASFSCINVLVLAFSDSIVPLAKLITVCVGDENLPGWVCVEDDEKTKPPFWCPLLACRVPVFTPKLQDLKVSERHPTTPTPTICICEFFKGQFTQK